jgi:hypothetical protein
MGGLAFSNSFLAKRCLVKDGRAKLAEAVFIQFIPWIQNLLPNIFLPILFQRAVSSVVPSFESC